ncbi:hypothetical protein SAMN05443667_101407 [Flavobacterium gillisiae]|uniref:Uncharacterized protein n=1 Tax=Flavobacterium gillisiae TaxID=150146 RepID=A0A1H3X787_9FLAO|nr:hypothetical protein SAMN05443667_101407 [Flavobacterium gillisiae]
MQYRSNYKEALSGTLETLFFTRTYNGKAEAALYYNIKLHYK